jgi:tmRNA-binding protein
MKRIVSILVMLLLVGSVSGQVVLRNDFVIDKKKVKLKNQGLTYVTVNAGSHHHWNLNAYGQPAKSVRIDVRALLHKKVLTHHEVIESMYRPGAVFRQAYTPIPMYLFFERRNLKIPAFGYRALRD